MNFQDETDEGFVKIAEMHLAAINKACEGIPRDRWRLHVCWGNWEGPHVYDIALAKVLPVFYQANRGRSLDRVRQSAPPARICGVQEASVPEGQDFDPGRDRVDQRISSSIPKWSRGRIEEAVAAVGDRERVIASTDCGFGTFAGREWVAASIVWPKLKTMREGADLASQRLWGKKVA